MGPQLADIHVARVGEGARGRRNGGDLNLEELHCNPVSTGTGLLLPSLSPSSSNDGEDQQDDRQDGQNGQTP